MATTGAEVQIAQKPSDGPELAGMRPGPICSLVEVSAGECDQVMRC